MLYAELLHETDGRGRFQTVTPSDLYRVAATFARYRVTSLDVIRRTDRCARRMFLSELRDWGRRTCPDMQLLSHFSPHMMKPMANANDPLSGRLVRPWELRNFSADLSPMGAFLIPNHLMDNYVSRELDR